jgi:response regulator NasT
MSMMATQQRAERAHNAPERPERILVADDEHLVAAGLRSQLISLGYTVIGPASDGEHAIELARTQQPDLAILDIRMPHVNGLEAGEVISGELNIPVLIVSAFSDPEYLRSCNTFRTFGYMLKPVTTDALRVTIEVAWGRWLDHLTQQEDVDRLKARLEDRKIIEQAKWLLVKNRGISEPESMRLLQRQARNSRRTLIDIAKGIIEEEGGVTEE